MPESGNLDELSGRGLKTPFVVILLTKRMGKGGRTMMGRKWLISAMLIAVFLIAGFSMYMPRAGRISAQTSYWTPQMASYPTSDIGSFTNWPYNAFPFQTSSWFQTYPNFPHYSLPTTYSGFLDYRLTNSYPVASQFRWGSSYPGFSPFGLVSPFGRQNISFANKTNDYLEFGQSMIHFYTKAVRREEK